MLDSKPLYFAETVQGFTHSNSSPIMKAFIFEITKNQLNFKKSLIKANNQKQRLGF
jgi:hypothetical protein